MRNKKIIILSLISILMIVGINSLTFFCFADTWDATLGNVESQGGSAGVSSFTKIMGAFIDITRVIAAGVAIIMLTAVAMKYLGSAPSERAEIKKHAVIYIVGAMVLFASTGILGIIKQFAGNING